MNTRRQALSLAALLAATVLAGGAAVAGIVHGPAQGQPAQPALVQQAPSQQQWQEEGD